MTFEGFERNDGSVGTRNYIGIISSVICSSTVVREISERIPQTVPFVHANGCTQLGDDFQLTKNILVGVTQNPNLYSSLFVGLGCETNQVGGMLEAAPKEKPIKGMAIQELAGGANAIVEGTRIAERWAEEAKKETRKTLPLSALKIGVLTVDLDEGSLRKVNPVITKVIDRLLNENANVLFGLSKTLEPAGQELAKRTDDEAMKKKFLALAEGMRRERWEKVQIERKEDDSWSEEEKHLSALEAQLIGKHSIDQLLPYGESSEKQGLHLLRVPSNIVEALSGMASAGCNAVLIVSSRGVLTGSVALPTITATAENEEDFLSDLVDYTITDDESEQQAALLLEEIIAICSGKPSKLEELELGEFAISHSGTPF